MKRSKKEYENALEFIRELLSNSSKSQSITNYNLINHQNSSRVLGLKSKDIEWRFNEWADKNEISKASLRTIQNYLETIKNQGLLQTKRINKHNYYWVADEGSSDTTPSNTKDLDYGRHELAKVLLKPWENALPSNLRKNWVQNAVQEHAETPTLTLAYPHYQHKDGFIDMILHFMALIKAGQICRFTYKPGHSSMDDNMSETPDGFAWMKVVWGMPLQINIYMDRVYLLTYSLTKADLLERRYTPVAENSRHLDYNRISRYVLANVNDFKVEALDEYIQKNEGLAHLKEPIEEFQADYSPASLLNRFNIPEIQKNIIGVVLPKIEQLNHDVEPSTMNDEQKEGYRSPKPIRRYFGGWAMRYILNSPLHPTQILKETKVLKEVPSKFIDEANNNNQTFEVGLFEFTVWHTVDFDFRIGSFRNYTWEEKYGFEGPPNGSIK
jgi:hypothetical protein